MTILQLTLHPFYSTGSKHYGFPTPGKIETYFVSHALHILYQKTLGQCEVKPVPQNEMEL